MMKRRSKANRLRRRVMSLAVFIAKDLKEDYGDYQMAMSLALKVSWKYYTQKNVYPYNKLKELWLQDLVSEVRFYAHKGYFSFDRDFVGCVPVWKIAEDRSKRDAIAVQYAAEGTIVEKETERAVLVKFIFDADEAEVFDEIGIDVFTGYIDRGLSMWVPKSIMNK